MRKNIKTNDLVEGAITSALLRLAMPLIASAFMSTVYTIMDMYWVGKLGAEILAGVGVAGMFTWLSGGVCKLASVGGQVYMGQTLGEGNKKRAGMFAGGSLQLGICLGVGYGVFSILFVNPMLAFFRLSSEVAILTAREYVYVACGLIVFQYLGLIFTCLFTAQGDSKSAMFANLIGLVSNMILDPILIFGVGSWDGFGGVGAAIATVMAQVIVVIIFLWKIRNLKDERNILRKEIIFQRYEWSIYKDILKLSWPVALQDMMYCMISMVLSRMVAAFGDTAIAVQRVGGQIEAISWNVANGFGSAINTFVAHNFGAKKRERMRKGFLVATGIVATEGFFVTLAFILFSRQISSCFFYTEEGIATFTTYLYIVGISELFMNVELMTAGALAGLGETSWASLVANIFTALRIPVAFVLTTYASMGLNGVWWALSSSSIAKGLLLFLTFHLLFRRKVKNGTI